MPTIEPTTVIPFRTVSKIGSWMVFSAGSADEHERPATPKRAVRLLERLRRHRQCDRLVGPSEPLDRGRRVLLGGVHRERRAELSGELELLLVEVDGHDAAAGDPRVLKREVTEAADAEDGDEVGWTRPATLTAL